MGNDADDIAIALAKSFQDKNDKLEEHIQAYIERSLGRAFLKIGIVGIASAVITICGSVITVTRYFDKMESVIKGQQQQIEDLQKKANKGQEAYDLALSAKSEADVTDAKLAGHLSVDPKKK